MKETEEFLAAELKKLSVQERAKALDDVHCVGEELQQTPEMLQQSLAEFVCFVQSNLFHCRRSEPSLRGRPRVSFEVSQDKYVRCKTICPSDDELLAAKAVYHVCFNILTAIPEVQRKGVVMIYYDESKGGD